MPLSEYEQQMLRQMEEALSAEDPQFVSQIRRHGSTSWSLHRVLVGALGIAAGLALVVVAVLNSWVWLGAIGFAVMVASAAHALWPRRRPTLSVVDADGTRHPAASSGGAHRLGRQRAQGGRPSGSSSFMQRLEQRWERRRGHDGF